MLHTLTPYLPLIGIPLVVIGFALRFNPVLVVTVSGIITGLVSGLSFDKILFVLGDSFLKARPLALFVLALPIIGLLERHGLKEHAQQWIGKMKAATTGRILLLYLFIRETAAAFGLKDLGGHAQMVRPLIAPMAEGAAENLYGDLPTAIREKIRAHAAAVDNIGVFFGEDIFLAFGAVILMSTFLEQNGYHVEPLRIGLWAIPTAICAFFIHGFRLWRFDRTLHREIAAHRAQVCPPEPLP
ncbi:MAG TPA: DUF969 domain-containing protein [Opitutaceae bacterium]|nr:DUF969 domain-containing protein [Opitutaceae bacterium]